MLEGRITKAVVVQDKTGLGTVLMGVAEFYEDQVNFQVRYDWETLDRDGFIHDLREKLAEDLDITVKQMNVYPALLLEKMRQGYEQFKVMN